MEDASIAAAQAWANSAKPQGGAKLPRPASGQPRLFVDASRSMMGFAGCTTRPTEFNTTLDRLTSDLGITRVVRFGERTRGTGEVFQAVEMGRGVHCPAFYDRLQNPDYALFRAARNDSTNGTVLYVTDGVQSDWRGSNPGPSLGLLTDWLAERRAIAILTFRSRFAGPAWSEQAQRMLPAVTTDRRPFYVFVLAATEADVDALLRRLSSGTLENASVLRFAPDGASCRVLPGKQLRKYVSRTAPPWTMVQFERLNTAGADRRADLEYACALRSDYPIAQVSPRVSARYLQWKSGKFNAIADAEGQIAFRAESSAVTPGGSSVRLAMTLPFDRTVRYGLYNLRVDADPGQIRSSIDSLSTDSDATTDSFDRTYRFSWLVERLARAQLARAPWAPHSLTVQYR